MFMFSWTKTLFIVIKLSLFYRECPEECREVVASLMYAAARFSDFPELRDLRDIFQQKYGSSLETFVNQKVIPLLFGRKGSTIFAFNSFDFLLLVCWETIFEASSERKETTGAARYSFGVFLKVGFQGFWTENGCCSSSFTGKVLFLSLIMFYQMRKRTRKKRN